MSQDFVTQRKHLVEQVKAKGITDKKVLEALEAVPRHLFIPEEHWFEAYEDYPVPIGEGQTISQPYTVAFMTQLLDVSPGQKVLEIGTGSGYQAAILAELGAEVYTVERLRSLYEKAKQRFEQLGYTNIYPYYADGTQGLPQFAPFDRIIVTATGPLNQELIKQLKINGIMVAPIDDFLGYSTMFKLIKKSDNDYTVEKYPGFSFVPLIKGLD
jgi:protein-L-isoaspartate(D-aspartate) O-methyltransferase